MTASLSALETLTLFALIPWIIILTLSTTVLYLALTNRASFRRVGGLNFLKIGRLSISFSVAKTSDFERRAARERRSFFRSLTRQGNQYWIQKGKQAHKKKIDLLNDTKFARIDSQLKQIEWTPDDWMLGFDDFDTRPTMN